MATRMATSARVDPDIVRTVVEGRHGDPFAVLGLHQGQLRTFQPDAREVHVLDGGGRRLAALERTEATGFFEGAVAKLKPGDAYRLEVDGRVVDDPYRFAPLLGEVDVYLLAEGRHRRLYEKLGAHPYEVDGVQGVSFAVWAPNATRCSVIGDFNQWDGRRHPMRKRVECGVWELFVPGVEVGALYKYELLGPEGELLPLKADPVAFRAQHPPETASVVAGLVDHPWSDGAWMAEREHRQRPDAPVSVYEVHLGSWQRIGTGAGRYLSYQELADKLVSYVADMGFTHIELLPVSEYPFDGSWGYQPTGLYAPTIRHGTAEEFAAFVDACHQAGIGVIIDWVPAHFPSDAHGLAYFDGTALYEHQDPRKGFHHDWNTLIYNYGRSEVDNFLLANALYWLDRFHIDGLRVDAVASMLYLNYSREEGEWIPNQYGGNENLEAIAFLRHMNELVYGEHSGAMTLAEESTAWPAVSRPTYLGGLGFGFKWNMGWMHDTLHYFGLEPVHRKFHQNDLTFGLLYAFSENFVLPLSHDEVVHGKGSLLARMPGDTWQKFANLRAYYGFMWTHPGKKLLFMGSEFAQGREWTHEYSLDWHLLEIDEHRGVQRLVKDLNHLYRATPALYAHDSEVDGFEWIDASDSEQSVVTYLRRAPGGGLAVVACNLTPVPRHGYRVGVPVPGGFAERLNTDDPAYGGSGVVNGTIEAEEVSWHGRPYSLSLTLPPLSTVIFIPQ